MRIYNFKSKNFNSPDSVEVLFELVDVEMVMSIFSGSSCSMSRSSENVHTVS